MGVENFVRVSSASRGQRQAKRSRVLLSARLQTPSGELDVRLRDLSRKGALLECAVMPPVGSEVVFERGATIVPARVAWSGAGRIGIEFHRPIDENELLVQLKRASVAAPQQRFRRPGLNEDLSDRERKVAQTWGVKVGLTVPDGQF